MTRLRRSAAALLPIVLLPSLAACGGGGKDDAGTATGTATSTGLSQVSFTGDVGKAVKASWHATIAAPKTTSVRTLVKGSGDKIAANDTVSTYLWLGDGTTKKDVFSDYQQGAAETLPNNGKLGPAFTKIFAGATYGSRVVAVTNATELLGSAAAATQLGIGKDDSLVVVADLVKKAEASPKPADDKVHDVPASKLPAVTEKAGKPTGLDWKGVAKPDLTTPVQRTILKQGTGKAVQAGDKVTVNYLGETYGATSAFDESYSKQPFTTTLSDVIPGWGIGLTGVKVGSRVLLQIPPAYAYGAQGSGAIPANATLWFVVDVVKAQ